jgi:hypothetical protein
MNTISIKFLRPAVSGETVYFTFYANYPDTTEFVRSAQAVPTRAFPGQFSTGSTATLQAEEYYDAFLLDYGSQFDVVLNGDTVIITPDNASPLFNASTGLQPPFSQLVQFTITGAIDDVTDVRARSPYLLISTGTTATTFTESVFTISQFEGDIDTYATQPVSYVKTKQKITPFQDNIWINISNLVREDLEADIDYYQDNDYTTARNLSTNESKWVYINTVNQYLSTGVTTGDTFYFVVDGYIEPSETQGLPNLLITGDKRYIYRGSNERLYFKTDNLTGATYSTPTTGPTSITFSGDSEMNYGYVKSIKVNIPLTEDRVTYTFNYSGQTPQTVTYYLYDECKYENYDLVFKNKYGMMETLSMSKKSSKTLNVDSTDYLRSIVNLEGEYNVNRHTKKQFNVNGMEEWVLNTDFVPEYMNAPIKEAMLTEEMWLIDSLGNIIPVVKMDQNIAFKTSLNDKMIQYTIRVGLSHNTVQNII